jgi:hypothetical protein
MWFIKKFHWVVSKMPASLMDTVSALCERQNILLRSHGLIAAQKTAHQLNHPGLGSNKPSTLVDQLSTLKPDSLDDVIQALFFRKIPRYIRDMVNPKDYKNLYNFTQHCREVWENRGADGNVMSAAAAVQRSQSFPRRTAPYIPLATIPPSQNGHSTGQVVLTQHAVPQQPHGGCTVFSKFDLV